jgi:MFS family permease
MNRMDGISRPRAWYSTLFLMLLYSVSYVDRYALSLLASPISASLRMSDIEIGVLFGTGFGIVYSLTGLPLAHLIDRHRRLPIVAGGVILWTASTLASGLSSSFTGLLLCRSGVAIGEAVLSPAAISIIGDLFTRERRILPTSLYVAIAGFMQGGAFVVCGLAIDLATRLAKAVPLAPWRLTLIVLGLSGLILGIVFYLTLDEPPRANAASRFESPREAASYFWNQRSLYGWMFVGMAAMGSTGAAFLAWTPTLLVRAFHETTANAGYLFGTVAAAAALVGALCWPFLVFQGARIGYRTAPVSLLAIGLGIGIAAMAVIGATTSLPVALGGVAIAMFGVGASGILPPLIIQSVAPSRMRGRLIAMNFMASSLVGLPIGPPLTAAIAGSFYTGPHAIGYAMTTIAVICGPIATISMLLARSRYALALADAIQLERPADTAEQAFLQSRGSVRCDLPR